MTSKSESPKISVIIPVYNVGQYLPKCMDSVINQTLRDIEIICVDDGSTDNSAEILSRYADKDERIILIRQANGGAGAARNNGLQYARGEYLSILDSDDFFEPDMLEKSYEAAKNAQADIIVFGCDYYDEASAGFRCCPNAINRLLLPKKSVFSISDVKKDFFRLFTGWAWDKLFKTEFIKDKGLTFQEQRTTNDMLFVFSALSLAERITTIPNILAHHRRAGGTLSVTREKSWTCFYNALTALKDNLKSFGLFEKTERDFVNYALHFSLWNLNSLTEPAYSKLYKALRGEWFDNLGITGRKRSFFYNRHQYRTCKRMMKRDNPGKRPSKLKKWADGNVFQRALKGVADNGFAYTLKYFLMTVLHKRSTRNI